MGISAYIFWLILGGIFIILEVTAFTGIGLFIAGLGAISLGGLIAIGLAEDFIITGQIAMFMSLTSIWWIFLWKPLKNIGKKSGVKEYKNLIGTYGEVDTEEGLLEGKLGYVKWSGTRMRAKIRPESESNFIPNNAAVWVYDQVDGILLVDDKEIINNKNGE